MTREAWYIYYRLFRIARRECSKAATDMILFGTGFVLFDEYGEAQCIPPNLVTIDDEANISIG